MNDEVFVIAEAGVNHNGDLAMAHKLVDVAVIAGANAVKFQTFIPENLVTSSVHKAHYQLRSDSSQASQLEMLKKLVLPRAWHKELKNHAESEGLVFMSTPFDEQSLVFLADEIEIDRVKIASGELTNLPFLWRVGALGLPVILSTGMGSLHEVQAALAAIALGNLEPRPPRSSSEFYEKAQHLDVSTSLQEKVTILHCTTAYPTPPSEVNLRAMVTLRDAFKLPVGLSDHTKGNIAAIGAVALGATLIEKHITMNRNFAGPDHQASMEPEEFGLFVQSIREASANRGTGIKEPTKSELTIDSLVRRVVVANRPIQQGRTLSERDLALKRAGTGMQPISIWDLVGRKASHDYNTDDPI